VEAVRGRGISPHPEDETAALAAHGTCGRDSESSAEATSHSGGSTAATALPQDSHCDSEILPRIRLSLAAPPECRCSDHPTVYEKIGGDQFPGRSVMVDGSAAAGEAEAAGSGGGHWSGEDALGEEGVGAAAGRAGEAIHCGLQDRPSVSKASLGNDHEAQGGRRGWGVG